MYKNVSIESNVRIITKIHTVIHGEEKNARIILSNGKSDSIVCTSISIQKGTKFNNAFFVVVKISVDSHNIHVYEPAKREMSSDITSQHFNIESVKQ